MKKLVVAFVLALTLVIASAIPAFAAVRVSARAKTQVASGRASKVLFTAKVTRRGHMRRGRVRIAIYRNGHKVRTVRAKRVGKRYVAWWNLRTASGSTVRPGSYTYRVSAATNSGRGKTKGTVIVPTTTTTTTTTTPTTTTAPTTTTTAPTTTATSTSEPATTTTVVAPVVVAAPAPSRWIGFYVPGSPADMTALNTLESQVGTTSAVVNFFISDWESFPLARVQACASNGSIPMITLEFTRYVNAGGVDAILSGQNDTYLTNFAAAAKAYGGEVWLRPFHEMNGNWYGWSGTVGSNTSAKTVAAWKYVHDFLYSRGATNVKFVWNMNASSVPNTSANAIEKYWPGDAYVDYTSIDGYNFGLHATWSSWQTPKQIFGDAYTRINALTTKPMFIAETACTSNGGDKATWMKNFFVNMKTDFPKVKGVCWFNADKEEDWRVEQTTETLAVVKWVAANGY